MISQKYLFSAAGSYKCLMTSTFPQKCTAVPLRFVCFPHPLQTILTSQTKLKWIHRVVFSGSLQYVMFFLQQPLVIKVLLTHVQCCAGKSCRTCSVGPFQLNFMGKLVGCNVCKSHGQPFMLSVSAASCI